MNAFAKSLTYLRDEGLPATTRRAARSVARRLRSFRRDPIEARRQRLSREVFEQLGGTVRYGPLAGVKLSGDPSWGAGDKASMILGLYEQELLHSILEAGKDRKTLIDVGAADGYYGVGLVAAGFFDQSICYELTEKGRQTIAAVAEANGCRDRVTIHGAADEKRLIDMASTNSDISDSLIIIDIEGGEFDLLNAEVLKTFVDSPIFVELHERWSADGELKLAALMERAGETHEISRILPGARDPTKFSELVGFCENDRWLICSEGRLITQTWLQMLRKV